MKKDGLKQCSEFWDMSGRAPKAKKPIPCPSCRSTDTIPRRYMFHTVKQSATFYRCNIYYKCQNCSMAYKMYNPNFPQRGDWFHGVVISKEMFDKNVPKGMTGIMLHWSEV